VSAGPENLDAAAALAGEYRAGGTDLQHRLRRRISSGPPIDLAAVPDLHGIGADETGAVRIGALTTIAALATEPKLAAYPALAQAAAALATPQIRAVGTLGGNLLQRNRCWYFRDPDTACFRKGGPSCPARDGNHLYHACFDRGPCIAVHPSTLAMTLLTYDATVEIAGRPARPVQDLYGDGSDPHRDHQLGAGEILTAVRMPAPMPNERAGYVRATSRALAEWPLVEAVVRLRIADGAIASAGVGLGGVAPVPLRCRAVEAALTGRPPSESVFAQAAALAAADARPLPMTGYKVGLIASTIVAALERAAQGWSSTARG
jgi:xanthine dehydrogenase YagS FAD-binding subunit